MSNAILSQVKTRLAELKIQVSAEYESKIRNLIRLYLRADVTDIVHKIVFDVKREKGIA